MYVSAGTAGAGPAGGQGLPCPPGDAPVLCPPRPAPQCDLCGPAGHNPRVRAEIPAVRAAGPEPPALGEAAGALHKAEAVPLGEVRGQAPAGPWWSELGERRPGINLFVGDGAVF